MKKRTKLIILIGIAFIILAILAVGVIRYVPWHKFIKVPTSNEIAFIQKDPMTNKAPNTLRFDFEVDPSQGVPNGIYEGLAHSGKYSAKAFGKSSFSVNVVRSAGEIGLENLDGVAMSAWVYVFPTDDEVNGSLVFAANNSVGTNICWKGVHFSGPMIPRETWTKISGYFDLSDVRLRNDDQIQLYFWNNSSTDILVDDFCYVFGAPHERPGDSAIVDMTRKGGFAPRFNTPPYPLLLTYNQEIGNGAFLITANGAPAGEITPSDKVIAGHFITRPGDLQSMLVITPEGKPALYHYCRDRKGFAEIPLECPPELGPVLSGSIMECGAFLPGGSDQLLAAGGSGMALLGFEAAADPCRGNRPAARIRVLWRSDTTSLAGIPLQQERQLTCGDLNGDRTDEILLFTREGSWKILRFSPGGASGGSWSELADGKEYKVRQWNPALAEFRAMAGPWLTSGPDQVLTVFREVSTGKLHYMLMRYQPGDGKFTDVYPDRQGGTGRTIGIDTLKMTDQFMPGRFGPGKPPAFLRYNRDWRYNLKEIRFNDTTFQVLTSIEFTGYEADRNPKYYEILKLHAGFWTEPSVTTLLVVGRNCQDPGYAGGPCGSYEPDPTLPDMLQIYSFTPNKP